MNRLDWIYERNFATLLKFLIGALVLVFIANCFTPLRLHVDTIRYFVIKDCIEFGCLPDSNGALDYLPIGYTGLLLGLSKIGLLKSFVIVLINCIFLFISILLISKVFDKSMNVYFFVILVLVNWTILKFVIHPLSEMQYLFFSCCSLYFFNRFTKSREIWPLLGSFVFAGLSFVTRTVGVTLLAALVIGLIWEFRKELVAFIKNNKAVVPSLLVVIILVGVYSKQLGLNHYTQVFSKQFDEGVLFSDVLRWHFIEWAEIFFNVPFTKLLDFSPSLVRAFFLSGGIAIFFGTLCIMFVQRDRIPVIVILYLIFYCILMFNWPFYDPRFWVPVLPIYLAILAQQPILSLKSRKFKLLTISAFLCYFFLGIISLGYFTMTSLDHDLLARTQANGVYRKEYEIIFHRDKQSDRNDVKPDSVIVHLLLRYSK